MSMDTIVTINGDLTTTKVGTEDYETYNADTFGDSFIINMKNSDLPVNQQKKITNLQISFAGGNFASLQIFFDLKDEEIESKENKKEKSKIISSTVYTTSRPLILEEIYKLYNQLKLHEDERRILTLNIEFFKDPLDSLNAILSDKSIAELLEEGQMTDIFLNKFVMLFLTMIVNNANIISIKDGIGILKDNNFDLDQSILSILNIKAKK